MLSMYGMCQRWGNQFRKLYISDLPSEPFNKIHLYPVASPDGSVV